MTMEYIVRTESFEGPFELLLDLIKKREMKIHDLQISQITNDYIASLHDMSNQNIEVTSNFMEMASLLLEIKTKMLLPAEVEKGDPRAELVQQLLDYQEYKESVERLRELKQMEQMLIKRQRVEKVKIKKLGNLQDIIRSYHSIIEKKKNSVHSPFEKMLEEMTKITFTIEDCIAAIKKNIEEKPLNIEMYFDDMSSRQEIVVSFSGVLELVKMQYIDILITDSSEVLIAKRKGDKNE